MKPRSLSITVSLALACLLASLALPQATHAGKNEAHTDVVVQNDGVGLAFLAESANDLASLKVAISGPDGKIVFEERTEASLLEWVPDTKLADGQYGWHAQVITITPGAPQIELTKPAQTKAAGFEVGADTPVELAQSLGADQSVPMLKERLYAEAYKQVHQASGTLWVKGSMLMDAPPLDSKAKPAGDLDADGQSVGTKGTLIDDFVSLNDTGTDDNTRVNFFNSTSGNDMSIQNRSGTMKIMEGTGTGAVDSDTRLSIRDSLPWVGIGTDSPTRELHIVDSSPEIRLEDSSDSQDWYIKNTNSARFEIAARAFFTADCVGDSADDNCRSNPFTIEAPTTDTEASQQDQAIYIARNGNIGFGVDDPLLGLSVSKPIAGINLHDSDNGGSSQIAYNPTTEAIQIGALFDPGFRVSHFADSGSLSVASDNNVGVGTNAPGTSLHVRRSDGTARLLVQETSGTAAARELLRLTNNGGPFFVFENTDISQSYSFAMGATGHFILSHQQTSGVQMRLTPAGNLTISGSLAEGSSRAIKDDITPLDGETVLAKLESVPVSEWSYSADRTKRHAGPMAEDFYAAFGLGPDDEHISPRDLAGVALAAAKALKAENDALKARVSEIDAIKARLKELESRESL